MNLCSIPSTQADKDRLTAYISTTLYLIPQLNYRATAGTPGFPNISAQAVLSLASNNPSLISFFSQALASYHPLATNPCIDWNSTQSTQTTLQKAPFNYLLCNYFPLSSNEIPDGTIFPPTSVQTESDPDTCKQLFNLTPPTQEYVQQLSLIHI